MASPWSGPHRPAARGPDPWGCPQGVPRPDRALWCWELGRWLSMGAGSEGASGCSAGLSLLPPGSEPFASGPCLRVSQSGLSCSAQPLRACPEPAVSLAAKGPTRKSLARRLSHLLPRQSPRPHPPPRPAVSPAEPDPQPPGSASEASCPCSCPLPCSHPCAPGVPKRLPRPLLLSCSVSRDR